MSWQTENPDDAAFGSLADALTPFLGRVAQFTITGKTVSQLNAWLARSDLPKRRRLVGSMNVDATIIFQPASFIDMFEATFTAVAGMVEANMFNNRAVAVVQTVPGVSMTLGSNVITGTGFTADLDGKRVAVPNAGISAFSGRAPAYGIFQYVSATSANLLPVVKAKDTSAINAQINATGQTMQVFQVDRDITLMGGVIDRRPAPITAPDGNVKHVVLLRRVEGLTIIGTEVRSANAKYCFSLADIKDGVTANLSFPETSSDGLHFIGPLLNIRVENIRGTTHDDLVSFTAADYSLYSDTSGDILTVFVKNIVSEGSVTAFKLITGTGISARDFVVDGIHGTTTTRSIAIVDDYTGPTDVDIVLRGITVKTLSQTAAQLEYAATAGRGLVIDGFVFHPTAGRTRFTLPMINILGAPELIKMTNIRAAEVPEGANWLGLGIFVNGGTAITALQAEDWDVRGGRAGNNCNPFFMHTPVQAMDIGASRFQNVDTLMTGDYTSGTMRLLIDDVQVANCLHGIEWQASLELQYADCQIDAVTAYVRSRGSAVRSVAVGGRNLGGARSPANSQISLAGSTTAPTLRVVDASFPVDLSILSKTAGDRANNTNGALACGLGPAVSNGANWKGEFSGATY